MSVDYTKTNWVNGQTPINANNLNKIESGIEATATAVNSVTSEVESLKTNHGVGYGSSIGDATVTRDDFDIQYQYIELDSDLAVLKTYMNAEHKNQEVYITIDGVQQSVGWVMEDSALGYYVVGDNSLSWRVKHYRVRLWSDGRYSFELDPNVYSGSTHSFSSRIGDDTVSQIASKYIPSDTTKQDKLVSGTNIKTINSNSILGEGNIEVSSFPSTATAGDAMVYNGSEWAKQDGYGYEKEGYATKFASQDVTVDANEESGLRWFWSDDLYGEVSNLLAEENEGVVCRYTLNGTIYESEVYDDDGYWTIGPSYTSTPTEGQINIYRDPDESYWRIGYGSSATGTSLDITLQIEAYETSLYQINPKFISVDNGYGYTTSGTEVNITWDGDTTGKSHINFVDMMDIYKISDEVIADKASIPNTTFTQIGVPSSGGDPTENTSTFTAGQATTLAELFDDFGVTVTSGDASKVFGIFNFWDQIAICWSTAAQSITFTTEEGTTSTIDFESGIYVNKYINTNWTIYIKNISYTPSVVNQIASKYIPNPTLKTINNESLLGSGNITISGSLPAGTAASQAMVYNGSEWIKESGYGYTTNSTVLSETTWTFDDSLYCDDYESNLLTFVTNANNIGKTMYVTYDGTTYTTELKTATSSYKLEDKLNSRLDYYVYCGNGALYDSSWEDTGEPFIYGTRWTDEASMRLASTESSGDHTIKVTADTINTIANKLIYNGDILANSSDNAGLGYGGIITAYNDTTMVGRPSVALTSSGTAIGDTAVFYKLSDEYFEIDSNVDTTVGLTINESTSLQKVIAASEISELYESDSVSGSRSASGWLICHSDTVSTSQYSNAYEFAVVIKESNVTLDMSDLSTVLGTTVDNVSFPSAGVWSFPYIYYTYSVNSEMVNASYSSLDYWKFVDYDEIHQIDSAFIPASEVPILTITSDQVSSGTITFTDAQKTILNNNDIPIIGILSTSLIGSDTQYFKREILNVSANTIKFMSTLDGRDAYGTCNFGLITYSITDGTATIGGGYYVPGMSSEDVGKFLGVTHPADETYPQIDWVELPAATTSTAGTMSASDKTKLDSVQSGATATSVSSTGTATDEISYITINGVEKKIAGGVSYTAGDNIQINNNVISATDTTYSEATTSTAGLMSAADKTKLDGAAIKAGTGTNSVILNNISDVNTAYGVSSSAEGSSTVAVSDVIADLSTATDSEIMAAWQSATNKFTLAKGKNAHAEGSDGLALGENAHAEGTSSMATASSAHAEGNHCVAAANYGSHAEGNYTRASGMYGSHAEGHETIAYGNYASHAEGSACRAGCRGYQVQNVALYNDGTYNYITYSGTMELAEGVAVIFNTSSRVYTGTVDNYQGTKAIKTEQTIDPFVVGKNLTIFAVNASQEKGTYTEGNTSHAEGYNTRTMGSYAHAEGENTIAYREASHAEGANTNAFASFSHVEGQGTEARTNAQHVQGKYNIKDLNDAYADIVGNGTADSIRSNAFGLTWTGEGRYAGSVYANYNFSTNTGDKLSSVSVASTGTATDEISYITVDGVEKKIAGGSGATYTAGDNIQISASNVISATDTTYTPGTGISISGTVISADTTAMQEKLVSGTNIKTIGGTSILGSGDIAIPKQHHISIEYTPSGTVSFYISFDIHSLSNTAFTFDTLRAWLQSNNFDDETGTIKYMGINGTAKTASGTPYFLPVFGISASHGDTAYLYFRHIAQNDGSITYTAVQNTSLTITDTII